MATDLHVGVNASASATSSSALVLAVFWGRPRERQALRGHAKGMTSTHRRCLSSAHYLGQITQSCCFNSSERAIPQSSLTCKAGFHSCSSSCTSPRSDGEGVEAFEAEGPDSRPIHYQRARAAGLPPKTPWKSSRETRLRLLPPPR